MQEYAKNIKKIMRPTGPWAKGLAATGLIVGMALPVWYMRTHPTDKWYIHLGYGVITFCSALVGYSSGLSIGEQIDTRSRGG